MANSALLESDVLSAEDFNRLIPHIHDQKDFPVDMLDGLESIYRTHGVNNKYGCILLHRHYDMPDKYIALTTELGEHTSITKATPLSNVSSSAIRGQLYLLNEQGRFQAYEYEYGSPLSFPDAFLKELAAFIQANGLRDRIAITSSIEEKPRVEIQLGSDATVTYPPKDPNTSMKGQEANPSSKRTGWDFRDEPKPDIFCPLFYIQIGGGGPPRFCFLFYAGPPLKQIELKRGAEGNQVASSNDLSVKFPTSRPFDIEKHDVKQILREADLI